MGSRMRFGELLCLFGFAALLVGSFLPWYNVPLREDLGILQSVEPNAVIDQLGIQIVQGNMWDLNVLRWFGLIVLFWTSFVLLATSLGRTTAAATLTTVPASWFALILSIMIAVRVFDMPEPGATARTGIYVALAGAILIWLGAWRAMRDEHTPPAFDLAPEPQVVTRAQVDARAAQDAATQ